MDSRRTTATDSLRSSRSVACSCCAPLRGTWRAFDSWLITRVAILGVKITVYPGMRRSLFLRLRCLLHFLYFFLHTYLLRPSFKQSGLPFYNTLWFLGFRGSDACTKCHSHTGIRVRNTTLLVSPLGWKATVPKTYHKVPKKKTKKLLQTQQTPVSKRKKIAITSLDSLYKNIFTKKCPWTTNKTSWPAILHVPGWKLLKTLSRKTPVCGCSRN
jgi:hypothetical protein